ncbi:AAA family ATPase [Shimia sp.]|uniref:AAA family ATPase n=1 Tax=Shimia sp. TaxID=1954381 RepID=UPI003BA894E7
MNFKSLTLHEWRQFKDVNIDFHPSLTIITGTNGSGKSTILKILDHDDGPDGGNQFLATPVEDKTSGRSGYSLGSLFGRLNPFTRSTAASHSAFRYEVGSITYADGKTAELAVQDRSSLHYYLEVKGYQNTTGFKIESHRALPMYQQVDSLPVAGIAPKEAFSYFFESQANFQRGSSTHRRGRTVHNPVAPLKETLIGFAAFGSDNNHMKAVPELVGLYEGFQDTLRTLLPKEIGFERLEVRSPEIVVVSRTGEFPIDGASGGLMSLIQTAWQIFLFTKAHGEQVSVLLDEPENHLHPSLQRDFLSNLVRTFPKIQFVVATHSPFIISSVRNSRIYTLRYVELAEDIGDSKSAVVAEEVVLENKAGSASKILSEVLGVSVTIPIWAEAELEQIAGRFEKSSLTQEALDVLRTELAGAGLSEFFPEALGRVLRD